LPLKYEIIDCNFNLIGTNVASNNLGSEGKTPSRPRPTGV